MDEFQPEKETEASDTQGPAVSEEELLRLAESQGLAEGLTEPAHEDLGEDSASGHVEISQEKRAELSASMETILFMSDRPVGLPRLRSVVDPSVPLKIYREIMASLREEFAHEHRGIEIAEVSMGFQLRTKPQHAAVLRKLVKTQPMKLSGATMEVLAIVAYKQPVTKEEIDQVRGVDSGHVLRNLMEKRLVKIAGRSDLPGKPMIYATTHEFLELFNLRDTKQMPALHEVEAMVAASEVGFEEKAQNAMEQFGKVMDSSATVLFDDSMLDGELEAIRSEIAAIPTSTPFIEEQKAAEKRAAKLAELAPQGLTLDENDNIVPILPLNEGVSAENMIPSVTELGPTPTVEPEPSNA